MYLFVRIRYACAGDDDKELTLPSQWNDIGEGGARALAEALCCNATLTTLDLQVCV